MLYQYKLQERGRQWCPAKQMLIYFLAPLGIFSEAFIATLSHLQINTTLTVTYYKFQGLQKVIKVCKVWGKDAKTMHKIRASLFGVF